LIQVVEPGRFWIRAESPNAGCVTVDSIWIKRDCYLNIPNAFSPDGDGINDYFIPRDLLSSGLASFKMDIFNRWGENIYTTTTLDGRGWDGTFDGKPQNMGVYVYTLDVVFQNKVKKTFKGNVTLVR
jgi:gliding motility-associated-like protein